MNSNQIREQVAKSFVDAFEKGFAPWRKMWSEGVPRNAATGRAYRGVNILILQLAAAERGYESNTWGTFQQWIEKKTAVSRRPADVESGSWGTRIVLFKKAESREVDAETGERRKFPMLKFYTVFNEAQTEAGANLASRPRPASDFGDPDDYAVSDLLLARSNLAVDVGSPAYNASARSLLMPPRSSFSSLGAYHGTLLHEMSHWADHMIGTELVGLGRVSSKAESEDYAFNEMVAEISAAIVAATGEIPIPDDVYENRRSYVASWAKLVKADSNVIFRAAAKASKVAARLFELAPEVFAEELSAPEDATLAA